MRIRYPFAGSFLALLLLSAYIGLTQFTISPVNDKALHFIDFFLLTATFYFTPDTTRRRALNTTLLGITLTLSLASEALQHFLPNNGRTFDPLDVVANVAGSALALGLCTWYHKRMLERRRKRKREGYGIVPGDEEGLGEEGDVELGEGSGGGGGGGGVRGGGDREFGEEGEGEEDEDEDGAWDEIGGSEVGEGTRAGSGGDEGGK